MAAGHKILERMKERRRLRALPLSAFYGREPDQERERNRMYHQIEQAMKLDAQQPDLVVSPRRSFKMLDFTSHIGIVDTEASPLEYLVWRGELEGQLDEEGMAGIRFHTALRIRDLAAGARVNGAKSQTFSGMGGGGGGGAVDVSTYQIDCIRLMGQVRRDMPEEWMTPLLELVIVNDQWFDLRDIKGGAAARRRREMTLAALLYALDRAAVTFRYLPYATLRQRWPQAPGLPPSMRGPVRIAKAVTRQTEPAR